MLFDKYKKKQNIREKLKMFYVTILGTMKKNFFYLFLLLKYCFIFHAKFNTKQKFYLEH